MFHKAVNKLHQPLPLFLKARLFETLRAFIKSQGDKSRAVRKGCFVSGNPGKHFWKLSKCFPLDILVASGRSKSAYLIFNGTCFWQRKTCIINKEFVKQDVHVNLHVIHGVSIFVICPRCFKWVCFCGAKGVHFLIRLRFSISRHKSSLTVIVLCLYPVSKLRISLIWYQFLDKGKIDQITKHYNKCTVIILIRNRIYTKQEKQTNTRELCIWNMTQT